MGFYGTAALQSMGCYPASMEFDLMIAPFLPSHCGFFLIFGCRLFFLFADDGFQCFSANGCSAVSYDFGVYLRRVKPMSLLFHLELEIYIYYIKCKI